MDKWLLIGSLVMVCFACKKEALVPLNNPATDPIDHGIYTQDSLHSGAFCDFKPIFNEKGCWNEKIMVSEDCHYNLLFTRYGNGWTGADATYSLPLPDGRIMWMFGDTFLGTVRSDRTRDGTPLLRNTLIIQERDELITRFQGQGGMAKAFVSPANEEEWYWPLDATVHSGEIQWMLGRLGSSGVGGNWDFRYVGFDLAVLDMVDFSIKKIIPKVENPDISYGACVLEDEAYIYIYGISSRTLQKRAHIARAKGGDLEGAWEYFNGRDWTTSASSYVIQSGVSDQFSVIKDGGNYYLITHEIIFGNRIFIMEASSPTGPFENKRVLYCTPESSDVIFTYNSFVHPELSDEGELRISYNINSFDFSLLFKNADYYRPKFIRIDHWRE